MALRTDRQTSLEEEEFLLLRDPNAARFFHRLLELCLASQETQGFIYRFHDLSPLFVMSTSIRQLIAALSAPFRNLGKLQERRLDRGGGWCEGATQADPPTDLGHEPLVPFSIAGRLRPPILGFGSRRLIARYRPIPSYNRFTSARLM